LKKTQKRRKSNIYTKLLKNKFHSDNDIISKTILPHPTIHPYTMRHEHTALSSKFLTFNYALYSSVRALPSTTENAKEKEDEQKRAKERWK